MREFDVSIKGTAPGLLHHRFPETTSAQLMNPVKGRQKTNPTTEEDAEAACYRLTDGTLCVPSEHLLQSIIKGAGEFQVQGRGKKTYRDSIKATLTITPEYLPLDQKEYLIDSRPVRVQSARVVRHRPHYPEWSLTCRLVLSDDSVPDEVLGAVLVKAGEGVGIGDYRPRFGRFIIEKFKRIG